MFDCGSLTSKPKLNSAIHELKAICGKKQLDFVAISHFHQDHMNGLCELKKEIGFKKLFLPFISKNKEIRILFFGLNYFGVLEQNANFSNLTKEDFSNFENILGLFDNYGEYIGKEKWYSFDGWVFRFFQKSLSRKITTKLKIIINNLKNDGKRIDNNFFKDTDSLKTLQEMCKKEFNNEEINEICLLLMHYPLIQNKHFFGGFYSSTKIDFCQTICPCTLLTGDAIFDKNLAKDIIDKYPLGVSGIVQVPHHGAKKEWDIFNSFFPEFDIYVVTYGVENKYGHPSFFIRKDLAKKNFVEVTEFKGFSYWID